MPPCRLRRRNFWKFDYEMAHSEVYMNKYVVSLAPFSTSACPGCSQNIQKTVVFACFRFLIFHRFFTWPHLPLCADAHDLHEPIDSGMTTQFHQWPCTWARPSWTVLSPEPGANGGWWVRRRCGLSDAGRRWAVLPRSSPTEVAGTGRQGDRAKSAQENDHSRLSLCATIMTT